MKRYLLGLSIWAIVCCSWVMLWTPPVAADDATTSCNSAYTAKDEQDACKDGFNNGTGQGGVCSKYTGRPDGQKLDAACKVGWNAYSDGAKSCEDTYTTRSAGRVDRDETKIAECTASLRQGSTPPMPTPSATVTPDPSVKSVGQYPDNGDIKNLVLHKFRCDSKNPADCDPKNPRNCDPAKTSNCDPSEAKKCAIDGLLGNIICGTIQVASSVTDASYYLLSVMLKTDPVTQTNQANSQSAIYTSWAVFRNIANIMFVLAFLSIVLSYLTNMGLSNYNIKKMLPRMIIAALLINLSFWICALFVDAANILGVTLANTLGNITSLNVPTNNLTSWQFITSSLLVASAAGVAASLALIYGGLSVLAPVLLTALITIITVFLMLLVRQVLIILLIIISPLAFAAILLPGTNFLFEKWRKIAIPLLMLYPVVSFIFGMSKIASDIILSVAVNQDQVLVAILGLGIQIIPLLMLKKIMAMGGDALNRVDRIGDSQFVKKQRQKVDAYAKHKKEKRDLRALSGKDPGIFDIRKRAIRGKYNRQAKRQAIDDNLEHAQDADFRNQLGISDTEDEKENLVEATEDAEATNSTGDEQSPTDTDDSEGTTDTPDEDSGEGSDEADENTEDEEGDSREVNDSLLREMAQTDDPTALANVKNHMIKLKVKAKADLIEARRLQLKNDNVSRNEILDTAKNLDGTVSELTQDAAVLQIAQSGDIGALIELMKNSGNLSMSQRQAVIKGINSSGVGRKIAMLGNANMQDEFLKGNINGDNFHETVVEHSLMHDDYSSATWAELDSEVMKAVDSYRDKVDSGELVSRLSSQQLQDHGEAAYQALGTRETARNISRNSGQLEKLSEWRNSP